MLDIYPFILETIALLQPVLQRIARADSDLGRQARRAEASIALNVAEGMYSRGKNRQARYHNALGSARETLACLEVAAALGYIPVVELETCARFNRIYSKSLPGYSISLLMSACIIPQICNKSSEKSKIIGKFSDLVYGLI